ncbi:MAG: hypothetical protein IT223_10230 [Crocinitomicaceae bacterium]|nr:hypothetical protein [Crocinitomicaceae bacterium]
MKKSLSAIVIDKQCMSGGNDCCAVAVRSKRNTRNEKTFVSEVNIHPRTLDQKRHR